MSLIQATVGEPDQKAALLGGLFHGGDLHQYIAMRQHPATCMTYQPARHRIKFRDVVIGQRFYDPISEEYFVKQTVTTAAMVTGIGDGSIPDDFEPDDIVGIDH